jgi:acetylornithine aminotransferase
VTLTQTEGGLGWPSGQLDPESSTGGAKVFFSNSGAEANEGALKIARKIGKDRWAAAVPGRSWDLGECTKTRILCFENSFHGRTMGALSVTSNPKYQNPFVPLIPNVDVGKLNAMEDIERLVVDDTCAVIVEPVQGEGGINVAQEAWLKALRKRCDEVGAVLIFDEIQVRLRCGQSVETKWRQSAELCVRDTVWVVSKWNSLGAFSTSCRVSS